MKNKRKFKILFLTPWFPSNLNLSSGVFIEELAQTVSFEHEVIVIHSEAISKIKGFTKFSSVEKKDNLRIFRFYHKELNPRLLSIFLMTYNMLQGFGYLKKKKWVPDLIHANVYESALAAYLMNKRANIPYIVSEHWSGFPLKKLNIFSLKLAKMVFEDANVVLPVSRFLMEAIKGYGIKAKYRVLPNVVDESIFFPSAASISSSQSTKKILFVGRLHPIKGLDLLFRSLNHLTKLRNDFELYLVGDGPLMQKLKNYTVNFRVKFYGFLPKKEIAELMRRSDFLVLPSYQETFGCVIVEAHMTGLPVVASRVGGIVELITPENGIMVPPGDENALSEAILWMLDNFKIFDKKKIAEEAKKVFSRGSVLDRLTRIYNSIIYT
ncbi:hypothetical protein DRN58_00545 [Thermococci archaeon]|nr:MAG: hypothetical protein DRN58_00545 [Thermococci archaeon]